jgi:hypothetical protein
MQQQAVCSRPITLLMPMGARKSVISRILQASIGRLLSAQPKEGGHDQSRLPKFVS